MQNHWDLDEALGETPAWLVRKFVRCPHQDPVMGGDPWASKEMQGQGQDDPSLLPVCGPPSRPSCRGLGNTLVRGLHDFHVTSVVKKKT